MKRRLKHIIFTGVALMLCAVMLGGAVLAAQAPSASDALNYGKDGAGSNEVLNAKALFERVFGAVTNANEAAYLESLCGITLTYNSAIPDSVITTNYHTESGRLEVSLAAYSFTASNGATVSWIPTEAHIEDRSTPFSLSDGIYTCQFEDLFEIGTGNFDMAVDFAWSVELPEGAADELLNAAYRAGAEALVEIQAYEAEYALYRDELEKYLAYQAYLQALSDYSAFLEANDAYDTALSAYRAYLTAYEAYITNGTDYKSQLKQYNTALGAYQAALVNVKTDSTSEALATYNTAHEKYAAKLKAYEDWQHYYAYQDFLKNDLENYNAYLTYVAKVEKITKKLNVLETLFVSDSHGWQLYASLMGNTVATVVARKNELITAGCSEKDINAAGASTVILRELMQGYAELREAEYPSEHARLTALYSYYSTHYETLRDQFTELHRALYSLYGNSLVKVNLQSEGKLEHYQQFVGQLHVTAVCLDDASTWDSRWEMSGKKVTDVVEAVQMLTDYNTAAPGEDQMPLDEVPAVEQVEPIEKPTVPYVKDKPVEPVAPTALLKPIMLTDPAQNPVPPADAPRKEPIYPALDTRLIALAEDVRTERLQEREVSSSPRTLTLEKTVSRLVSIDNRKTVTFLSADGTTVLDQHVVEYGSTVYYNGGSTAKDSDEQYHYVFLGWMLADGTEVRLPLTADRDLTLYANYNKQTRYYNVTWILDGVEKTVYDLPYGAIPRPPFDVTITEDDRYTYSFSGWFCDGADEAAEPTPVTGHTTYVGSLNRTPRLFTVTWDLGDRRVTEQLPYGAYPAFDGTPERAPDENRYTFLAWDRPFETVTRDVTYTARYSQTPLATALDGTEMSVTHTSDSLTVHCTKNRVDILEAALFALEQEKSLTLQWEQFAVTLECEGLEALTASAARQIKITDVTTDTYGTVYTFGYCNNTGNVLDIDIPSTVRVVSDEDTTLVGYLQTGDDWLAVGEDAAEIRGGATFRVSGTFYIKVGQVENCNLSTLPSTAAAGAWIDLRLGCVFGYEVAAARLVLSDGTTIPVEDLRFKMPQSDVTLELTISRIVYHVTFVSDGQIVSEADYFLGEQIVPPANPTKASDSLYHYVFRSWSKDVTLAMGDDRNLVYEALYSQTEIPLVDPYRSGNNNNAFLTVVLPILGGVALVVAAVVIVLRVIKKRKTLIDTAEPEATSKTEEATSEQADIPQTDLPDDTEVNAEADTDAVTEPIDTPQASPPDTDADEPTQNVSETSELPQN